ncbi:hypothetical protein [uncultured Sphingomonas sp.]|nr:hypothetical protein [uncultured Sphingomonas sp.]
MTAGSRTGQRQDAMIESLRIGAVSFFATALVLFLGAGTGLIG